MRSTRIGSSITWKSAMKNVFLTKLIGKCTQPNKKYLNRIVSVLDQSDYKWLNKMIK